MNVNNGYLRGCLYFAMAALPPLGIALKTWSQKAPDNFYEVGEVVISCALAGLVSWRAFIDQHLSRNPAPEDMNKPVTTPVTTQVVANQTLEEKVVPPVKAGDVVYSEPTVKK